jgi:hypothetical protein
MLQIVGAHAAGIADGPRFALGDLPWYVASAFWTGTNYSLTGLSGTLGLFFLPMV